MEVHAVICDIAAKVGGGEKAAPKVAGISICFFFLPSFLVIFFFLLGNYSMSH